MYDIKPIQFKCSQHQLNSVGVWLFLNRVRCEAKEALQCWLTRGPPDLWAARPLVPGLSGTYQACHHPVPAYRAKQAADTGVHISICICCGVEMSWLVLLLLLFVLFIFNFHRSRFMRYPLQNLTTFL